jgi:hypothetical protein
MTSLLSQLRRNEHFKCVQYKESNAVTRHGTMSKTLILSPSLLAGSRATINLTEDTSSDEWHAELATQYTADFLSVRMTDLNRGVLINCLTRG